MKPNLENLDQDLTVLLNTMFMIQKDINPDLHPSVIRARVVADNFKALVNLILMADEENSPVKINLKALSLGLLAAADWLTQEETPNAVS